jgi:hypothetical protein
MVPLSVPNIAPTAVYTENSILTCIGAMTALLSFLLAALVSPFRSNSSLLAENALLRHQVTVLRRKTKGRVSLTNGDRWFFVQLYHWFPSILDSMVVIKPETLIRWHRAGFRLYWR